MCLITGKGYWGCSFLCVLLLGRVTEVAPLHISCYWVGLQGPLIFICLITKEGRWNCSSSWVLLLGTVTRDAPLHLSWFWGGVTEVALFHVGRRVSGVASLNVSCYLGGLLGSLLLMCLVKGVTPHVSCWLGGLLRLIHFIYVVSGECYWGHSFSSVLLLERVTGTAPLHMSCYWGELLKHFSTCFLLIWMIVRVAPFLVSC